MQKNSSNWLIYFFLVFLLKFAMTASHNGRAITAYKYQSKAIIYQVIHQYFTSVCLKSR